MLLKITFLLSALSTLAIAHITAIQFFLYWKYFWLDIPMHILGGVCVALGISVLPLFRIQLPKRYETVFIYCVVTLAVGIAWELFEILIGIPVTEEGFFVDVSIDLGMDVLGGLIGYGIVKNIQKL